VSLIVFLRDRRPLIILSLFLTDRLGQCGVDVRLRCLEYGHCGVQERFFDFLNGRFAMTTSRTLRLRRFFGKLEVCADDSRQVIGIKSSSVGG
jgi:hypothetical protein